MYELAIYTLSHVSLLNSTGSDLDYRGTWGKNFWGAPFNLFQEIFQFEFQFELLLTL